MTIRKIVEKNLLKDLAGIAMEYEEPCDRVPDIKKHCKSGRYSHADPVAPKTGLNCRRYCTRDRLEKAWFTLPDRISWVDFCIAHLQPIDFYAIDEDGNEFPNFADQKSIREWTIIYDLSDAKNCKDEVDLISVIDRNFPLDGRTRKESVLMEDSFGSRTGLWGVQDVLVSRPENYILVVQSAGYNK